MVHSPIEYNIHSIAKIGYLKMSSAYSSGRQVPSFELALLQL
jgi:hypothetical protein